MAGKLVKDQLRKDVALWFADGIIERHTLDVLGERYETRRFGWMGVVKYLGIAGGLFAFFGLLGLLTFMTELTGFAALELMGLGGGLAYWGLRLAGNVQDRYTTSSKVVVTLGAVLWTSGVGVFGSVLGFEGYDILFFTGILSLPIAFFLSYRSRSAYLLILTLLGTFHWIGAWNSMMGRSGYLFAVQDPLFMCVVALVVIGIGVYHERNLYPRTGRMYQVWESLGLVYLNMSLLILSIWAESKAEALLWIVVFTGVCLAQIALGARWQSGLFRGFGITFFVIDVFTRYHELFWGTMNLGAYLLIGGVCLAVVGGVIQAFKRALRTRGSAA